MPLFPHLIYIIPHQEHATSFPKGLISLSHEGKNTVALPLGACTLGEIELQQNYFKSILKLIYPNETTFPLTLTLLKQPYELTSEK